MLDKKIFFNLKFGYRSNVKKPMEKKKLTCKNCPFYTGVQCHGHGEYWGNCTLVNQAYRVLDKEAGKDYYISTGFRDVCFDDSECLFIRYSLFEFKHL